MTISASVPCALTRPDATSDARTGCIASSTASSGRWAKICFRVGCTRPKSRRAEEPKSRRAEEPRAEEPKSRRAEEQKSRRAEEQWFKNYELLKDFREI